MGNVCGCVKAEKEEQYLDPAKTPWSPEKYSPGRKYFRRKPIKKIINDTEPGEPNNENEGKKKSSIQLSREQPVLLSRGLAQGESAAPDLTLEDGIRQKKAEVVADGVKQKLLPSAVSSWPYGVNISPAEGSETEIKVSELDEGISEKDSTPYCAKRKKHVDDVNTREVTFQCKTDVFSLRNAASVSSTDCGTERALEKSEFSEDPSKTFSSGQEKQNTERFCPHEIHHFQLGKERCHSLCTNVPSTSRDTNENEISDIHVTGESEDMSAKERLLLWTQQATEGYAGVRCENFTTCWRDGKLFNAIIHKYRPDLIDMNTVAVQSNLANLEHAFYVAEKNWCHQTSGSGRC